MRLEELSRVLRATDPAAVLVAPAVLARVIQKVTGASWAVWRVPHGHCFLVDRSTLFKHVEQDELDLPPDHQLPQTVLLLERPSADRLAGPREDLLARYWRLLFHVAVHRELEARLTGATPADVRASGSSGSARPRSRRPATSSPRTATSPRTPTTGQAYVEFVAVLPGAAVLRPGT